MLTPAPETSHPSKRVAPFLRFSPRGRLSLFEIKVQDTAER